MSVDAIYTLDKVVLPGPVPLDQVRSQAIEAGITDMAARGGAHVDPLFRAILQQAPLCRFSTTQFATLFGAVPFGGAATGASTELYFKQWGAVGPLARAGLSHFRFSAAVGLVYWDSVELDTASEARAECVFVPAYGGSTAPLVPAGGVALSGTMQSGEHFILGPTYINGTLLPGVQRISVSSGITLRTEFGDGDVWPTFVGVEVTDPTITITPRNPALWATLGIDGGPLDGANGCVFYAQRLTNNVAGGVARVAGATTSHAQFAALNGTYAFDRGEGSDTGAAEFSITVRPTSVNDTTRPIIVTPGVALP